MSPTRYTVLICTHNRCRVLPRALEAVTQLSAPPGGCFEVLVVDNASRDETGAVVQEFAARSLIPIRYLFEPRTGKSIALNTGIAACTSEFIVFTDDDACPYSNWLQRIDDTFRQQNADWVFGKVEALWETAPPTWFGPEVRSWFAVLDYGNELFLAQEPRHSFYGVNLAGRRSSFAELGGFREDRGPQGDRGALGEDDDLFRRAVAAGQRIVYSPEVVVRHIIPPQRCTKNYHRRNTWRSTELYLEHLRANPQPVPTILGLPRYFLRRPFDHLVRWVSSRLRGNRSAAFFHEVQCLRFSALIYRALRNSLQTKKEPAPLRDPHPSGCVQQASLGRPSP